jgi:hypothetical membrane protein
VTATIPTPGRPRTAAALTAVAVLLGVTVVAAGELTPGYDHRYDTVSRLASPGQPFAAVVRSAIVAVGVLIGLTARELGASTAAAPRAVGRLVGVAGAAAVIVGVAPKDPPDVDPTAVSQLHVAASLVGVAALVAAMATTSWSGHRRAERRGAAAALILVVVAGMAFPFTWGSVLYGVLQRVVLLTALVWLVVTARRTRVHRTGEADVCPGGATESRWRTEERADEPEDANEDGSRRRGHGRGVGVGVGGRGRRPRRSGPGGGGGRAGPAGVRGDVGLDAPQRVAAVGPSPDERAVRST